MLSDGFWLTVRTLLGLGGVFAYENRKKLPRLTCPILIVHSRTDRVFPPYHAERLVRAQPAATLTWITGEHGEPSTHRQSDYDQALGAFLSRLGIPPPPPAYQ